MERERRKSGTGSFVSDQRKAKIAGKSYATRKNKKVEAKQEPCTQVSFVFLCVILVSIILYLVLGIL